MARIINQNNEVIATREGNEKKATVSPVSLIVGIALSVAALAVIIVIILFLTKKENTDKEDNTTPLVQYIENYQGQTKTDNRIKLLKGFDAKYELEKFSGECYILVYNTSWMKDKESASYKAYEIMDSYLTGSKRSDGRELNSDPLLKAIENCGQDIYFFAIDYESVKKRDDESDRRYFTLDGVLPVTDIKAPMLFHYKSTETYDNMNDKDFLLADGSVDANGNPKYRASDWGAIIINQVNYINSLSNKEE